MLFNLGLQLVVVHDIPSRRVARLELPHFIIEATYVSNSGQLVHQFFFQVELAVGGCIRYPSYRHSRGHSRFTALLFTTEGCA